MFTKNFFKDKLILLLGGLIFLLAIVNVLLLLVQIDLSKIQITARHWLVDGNSQFYTAEPSYLYFFVAMAVIILISSWVIGYKIYDSFKPGAYFAFILGLFALLSNLLITQVLLTIN